MNYGEWILNVLGVYDNGNWLDELASDFGVEVLDRKFDMMEEIRSATSGATLHQHCHLGNYIAAGLFDAAVARACEELTAEIGAAFFLQLLGINTNDSDTNNAAYIQKWIKCLNNDHNLIFTAASKAQKAVEYIKSFTDNNASK